LLDPRPLPAAAPHSDPALERTLRATSIRRHGPIPSKPDSRNPGPLLVTGRLGHQWQGHGLLSGGRKRGGGGGGRGAAPGQAGWPAAARAGKRAARGGGGGAGEGEGGMPRGKASTVRSQALPSQAWA
jgi:hypothetical protein